jgi:hypothetical protein
MERPAIVGARTMMPAATSVNYLSSPFQKQRTKVAVFGLRPTDREAEPKEGRKSNCQHSHDWFDDNNENWAMAIGMVRIADAAVPRAGYTALNT